MKNVKLIKVLNKVVNSCLTNIWHIHIQNISNVKICPRKKAFRWKFLDGVPGEKRLETTALDTIFSRSNQNKGMLGLRWGPLETCSSGPRLLRAPQPHEGCYSQQQVMTAPQPAEAGDGAHYITEGPSMRQGPGLMREQAGERLTGGRVDGDARWVQCPLVPWAEHLSLPKSVPPGRRWVSNGSLISGDRAGG